MLLAHAQNVFSDMSSKTVLAKKSVINARHSTPLLEIVYHALMDGTLMMEHVSFQVGLLSLKIPLMDVLSMTQMDARLVNTEELELADLNAERLVTNVTLGMPAMELVLPAIADGLFQMDNA